MDIWSLQNGNTSRSTSLRILDRRDPSSCTSDLKFLLLPRSRQKPPSPLQRLGRRQQTRRQRRQGAPRFSPIRADLGLRVREHVRLSSAHPHLEALTWERKRKPSRCTRELWFRPGCADISSENVCSFRRLCLKFQTMDLRDNHKERQAGKGKKCKLRLRLGPAVAI